MPCLCSLGWKAASAGCKNPQIEDLFIAVREAAAPSLPTGRGAKVSRMDGR